MYELMYKFLHTCNIHIIVTEKTNVNTTSTKSCILQIDNIFLLDVLCPFLQKQQQQKTLK